jgi:hypothetical protein
LEVLTQYLLQPTNAQFAPAWNPVYRHIGMNARLKFGSPEGPIFTLSAPIFALTTMTWQLSQSSASQRRDLFLFIACHEAAILIKATFDVVLEGPMQGIWFWCLLGFGPGSVMVYRAHGAAGGNTA